MSKRLFSLAVVSLAALLVWSAPGLAASTPNEVLAGKAVNTWVQGGLRVSEKPFDLGVQGSGFFILQKTGSSDYLFTRNGELELDRDGYLVQKESKGRLMGVANGDLAPIRLSTAGRSSTSATLRSFRVNLDGSISGIYSDGHTYKVGQVALALFQNPRRLDRVATHLLQATEDSGRPFFGTPQDDGRRSIYGSSVEELDEFIYENSLER